MNDYQVKTIEENNRLGKFEMSPLPDHFGITLETHFAACCYLRFLEEQSSRFVSMVFTMNLRGWKV